MTPRRGALALGAIALVAALATGSRAIGVVGVGFLLRRRLDVAVGMAGRRTRRRQRRRSRRRPRSRGIASVSRSRRLAARACPLGSMSATRVGGSARRAQLPAAVARAGRHRLISTSAGCRVASSRCPDIGGRARRPPRPRHRETARDVRRRDDRRAAAARALSTVSSPMPGVPPATAAGSCCVDPPGSTSIPCASTSRASRCDACTGRRAPGAGSSWSRSSRTRRTTVSSCSSTAIRAARSASRRARASTRPFARRARSCRRTRREGGWRRSSRPDAVVRSSRCVRQADLDGAIGHLAAAEPTRSTGSGASSRATTPGSRAASSPS